MICSPGRFHLEQNETLETRGRMRGHRREEVLSGTLMEATSAFLSSNPCCFCVNLGNHSVKIPMLY